jgi:hypothetical protein
MTVLNQSAQPDSNSSFANRLDLRQPVKTGGHPLVAQQEPALTPQIEECVDAMKGGGFLLTRRSKAVELFDASGSKLPLPSLRETSMTISITNELTQREINRRRLIQLATAGVIAPTLLGARSGGSR